MTDVQISVDQMLAASTMQLTMLLNGATNRAAELEERNDRQSDKINELEQDLHVHGVANREAGEQIREQASRIKDLEFELETTNNALAIRGRSLDSQSDQISELVDKIRKLQRELDEARQSKHAPKVGDRVRIKPNARYISLKGNVVLHSAKGNDTDGFVGVITSLDVERNISVSESSDADWGWCVLPEDVEVLS